MVKLRLITTTHRATVVVFLQDCVFDRFGDLLPIPWHAVTPFLFTFLASQHRRHGIAGDTGTRIVHGDYSVFELGAQGLVG